MVELGKYAGAVLSAWAVSLGVIALLIAVTWAQSRRVRHELEAAEARLIEREGKTR